MRGLRTQESKSFENFFHIVQNKAKSQNKVFFLDSGEGNDITFSGSDLDIDGEDLTGWLIPENIADEFEKLWNKSSNNDFSEWSSYFCWAVWSMDEDVVKIQFS